MSTSNGDGLQEAENIKEQQRVHSNMLRRSTHACRCLRKENNYFCRNSKLEELNQKAVDSCNTQMIQCRCHKLRVMTETKVCFQFPILHQLETKDMLLKLHKQLPAPLSLK